jgi:hypothetical protein
MSVLPGEVGAPTFSDVGIYGAPLNYGAAPQWNKDSKISYEDWLKSFKPGAASTSEVTKATMREAGASLQSPIAGAMGRVGATGFGGSSPYNAYNKANARIKALNDIINKKHAYPVTLTGAQRQEAEANDAAEKQAAREELADLEQARLNEQQKEQQNVAGRNIAASAGQQVVNPQTGQVYTGGAAQRLQERLAREDFIEQQRAEGKNDMQIREALKTFSAGQTAAPPTSPTVAPGSTNVSAPTPEPAKKPYEPRPTPEPEIEPKTEAADTAKTPATDLRMGTTIFDALAENASPEMRSVLAALEMEAQRLLPELEMSREEFYDSEGKLIGSPYDAIQTLLERSEERLIKAEESTKEFLKGQYDRNEKFNAMKQESILNQLSYQRDRDVRDQIDANKEHLDRATIMLALQGGFGSTDGNREINDARLKGEQAIIDLNKEYGFKRADVSLHFTDLHNQAFDAYQQNWLKTTDDFETRISDLNIQGISNIAAKNQAISSAYKDYVKGIKDGRKEYASKITEATKFVYDAMKEDQKNKKASAMSTKDKLGYIASLRSGINQNKIITQANDVDGYYGALSAGYDEYVSLLSDIQSGKIDPSTVSLNPSQSAVVTSLARLLDPNSTVKNDEYERQVLGQSAPNIIKGWLQKLEAGGAGLTLADVQSMKKLADGLHDSWETKLSEAMQPFILDIQDWNASYPDAPIRYDQAIPVDRVHLPSQTMDAWGEAASFGSNVTSTGATRSNLGANSTLHDFFSVYAPSSDSNNPLAYAQDVAKKLGVTVDTPIGELRGKVEQFARAIADHEGFTSGASGLARVNNNPGNLKYIGQHGAVRGEKGFAKFATLQDGWDALENDILAKMGGRSNVAMNDEEYDGIEILPSEDDDFALVPKAHASDYKPMTSGFTLGYHPEQTAPLQLKVLGAFKDLSTGKTVYPMTTKDLAWYQSKPQNFIDLNKPMQSPVQISPIRGGNVDNTSSVLANLRTK